MKRSHHGKKTALAKEEPLPMFHLSLIQTKELQFIAARSFMAKKDGLRLGEQACQLL